MRRTVEYVVIYRQDSAGQWHPWCCVLAHEWRYAFWVRLPLILAHEPYQWQYCMTSYTTGGRPE